MKTSLADGLCDSECRNISLTLEMKERETGLPLKDVTSSAAPPFSFRPCALCGLHIFNKR
jgi:hypothetical protein